MNPDEEPRGVHREHVTAGQEEGSPGSARLPQESVAKQATRKSDGGKGGGKGAKGSSRSHGHTS